MNPILTLNDYASLSPLLILLAGCLVVLLVESFACRQTTQKSAFFLALLTLFGAMAAAVYAPISQNPLLTAWVRYDFLAQFFTLFFLGIGLGAALLSAAFFERFEAKQGEYYFLLLSSLAGLILIGVAADFLTLFLGLETLSISLYILCSYMKRWKISHEAAIKYFLIGSVGAAFLLYGIAFIYGASGTTRFDALLEAYRSSPDDAFFLAGIAFVTIGLAFKAAIVPFHVWAPDVYEGATTPVTAFMAVGTKVGAFAAFVRVFFDALPGFDFLWNDAIALLAYPTLIFANLLAMRQVQLRRFFAYSGISHAGYLLLPLAAGTSDALSALTFYLVIYSLATMGAFAVLAFLDCRPEGVVLQDLRGLFKRSPFLSAIFAVCLLTLAGIPPTAGFFAKFYIFKVAYHAGYFGLVIVGLLVTVFSAYYYLRIIGIMLAETPEEQAPPQPAWGAALLASVAFVSIAFVSIYPEFLFNLLKIPR